MVMEHGRMVVEQQHLANCQTVWCHRCLILMKIMSLMPRSVIPFWLSYGSPPLPPCPVFYARLDLPPSPAPVPIGFDCSFPARNKCRLRTFLYVVEHPYFRSAPNISADSYWSPWPPTARLDILSQNIFRTRYGASNGAQVCFIPMNCS